MNKDSNTVYLFIYYFFYIYSTDYKENFQDRDVFLNFSHFTFNF